MSKITVNNADIRVIQQENEDFISLTDMLKRNGACNYNGIHFRKNFVYLI